MVDVKSSFKELASLYTQDQHIVQGFWSEIESSYSGKQRFYHNLKHLQYMIELFKDYEQQLSYPNEVLFAIFYHDIIYRSTKSDNEEQSASVAKARLEQIGIKSGSILLVEELILATKHHDAKANSDAAFLIDFDLGILGESLETYQTYCNQIRKEYKLIPSFLYRKGRKKVLNHFLSRDHVYLTPTFQNQKEGKAIQNLQWELNSL
jgi:predicted metal-dependent HD superfamily phosphohydrolase